MILSDVTVDLSNNASIKLDNTQPRTGAFDSTFCCRMGTRKDSETTDCQKAAIDDGSFAASAYLHCSIAKPVVLLPRYECQPASDTTHLRDLTSAVASSLQLCNAEAEATPQASLARRHGHQEGPPQKHFAEQVYICLRTDRRSR